MGKDDDAKLYQRVTDAAGTGLTAMLCCDLKNDAELLNASLSLVSLLGKSLRADPKQLADSVIRRMALITIEDAKEIVDPCITAAQLSKFDISQEELENPTAKA